MGTSVEPWIVRWPRMARIPPPGRRCSPGDPAPCPPRGCTDPNVVLGPAPGVGKAEVRSRLSFRTGSRYLLEFLTWQPQTFATISGCTLA